MTYPSEMEMYPDVVSWLENRLPTQFRGAEIDVRDTHALPLNQYISRHRLGRYFDLDIWQTYEIQVDVTAFLKHPKWTGMLFVECKNTMISLRDLSQLLGYSRVAQPLRSYLISSVGIGNAPRSLLLTYDRTDVLEYYWERGRQPRTIVMGRFDRTSKQLESGTILPRGVE